MLERGYGYSREQIAIIVAVLPAREGLVVGTDLDIVRAANRNRGGGPDFCDLMIRFWRGLAGHGGSTGRSSRHHSRLLPVSGWGEARHLRVQAVPGQHRLGWPSLRIWPLDTVACSSAPAGNDRSGSGMHRD